MDKVRELWPLDQICLLEFDMNIHPQLEFSQSDDYSSLDLMVKLTRGSPDYLCTVWVQSSLYFLRKGFILILPGPLLNNVYVLGWWSYMDSRLTQNKKKTLHPMIILFIFLHMLKLCPGMVAISYFGLTNKMQIVYSVVKANSVQCCYGK